ncbi:TPA: hypothetical protein ACGZ9U_003537 [Elizabethkingia anophelis]
MKEIEEKFITKKSYIPPSIDIQFIEMEEGIASGSGSKVSPNNVNGLVDEIPVQWQGQEVIDLETQF